MNNMEQNILSFSLNKCVADIYTLFNFLERGNIFLGNHEISNKILTCLYPIVPHLSDTIYTKIYKSYNERTSWPNINKEMLIDNQLNLPIQINGKRKTEISVAPDLTEEALKELVLEESLIKNALLNSDLKRFIYVPKRIINLVI